MNNTMIILLESRTVFGSIKQDILARILPHMDEKLFFLAALPQFIRILAGNPCRSLSASQPNDGWVLVKSIGYPGVYPLHVCTTSFGRVRIILNHNSVHKCMKLEVGWRFASRLLILLLCEVLYSVLFILVIYSMQIDRSLRMQQGEEQAIA